MRVLIWATHPQFDVIAFAAHLDRLPGVEMLVAMRGRDAFLAQPFARRHPFSAPILDWSDPDLGRRLAEFRADVAVVDNRLPPTGSAPRLVHLGHGLGWKNYGAVDLWTFHQGLARFTGGPTRTPNPALFVLCHGPHDFRWRHEKWGFHPDNLRMIGMPFADLMAAPPYRRADLSADYALDLTRPTVLLNITWHYGGVFARPAGWRERLRRRLAGVDPRAADVAFVDRLAGALAARDANLLFCLHDRHRYDAAMRRLFEAVAARHANVELKYRDERPDNLADLTIADVMVTNYSSFVTPFYLTGRPAIHVRPVRDRDAPFAFAWLTFAGRFARRTSIAGGAYMLDLDDTGGPVVDDADATVAAVLAGLDDPRGNRVRAGAWLDRHLHRPVGGTCALLAEEVAALCRTPAPTEVP